jgi:uncharacterized protein YidB (DUF937 family)
MMGLLDEVGKMLSGGQSTGDAGAGGVANIAVVVEHLMAQEGGLQGLLTKFQQGGLGDVVASWVGTGQNLPISADQISKVLSNTQIGELAAKLGVDPQQASTYLAQYLPELVSKLTPNGQVPQGNDLLAQGAALLKGLFNS